jgi:putative ABC transport system permease protein
MRRTLEIVWNSFKIALQELKANKLRTFLSLFGITIGIFCIIGVLATVNSLEHNIQNEVKALGSNTIYIDKWDYSGNGSDYPWWKYVKRPDAKYEELKAIKERTSSASFAAFNISSNDKLEYGDNVLPGINIYGISEDYNSIQSIETEYGRYFSDAEFDYGTSVVVLGYEVAEKLFGRPELAVGKAVELRGRQAQVIGVIKKQGQSMIGGWNYDQSLLSTYRFMRQLFEERYSNPIIIVQGKDNIPTSYLAEELRGTLRSLRRISPTGEDNFSLNDINQFSQAVGQVFGSVRVGGAFIGIFSLLVGLFGVANIMFVTVRERTSQIGLKKAIGAKSGTILTEFLLESAFLCIIGGTIGITLVFLLTSVLSGVLDFPIFISTSNLILSVSICLIVGVLAGIIPAFIAARMNPVVAIRSK